MEVEVPHGKDNVLGLDSLWATSVQCHLNGLWTTQFPEAFDVVHLKQDKQSHFL